MALVLETSCPTPAAVQHSRAVSRSSGVALLLDELDEDRHPSRWTLMLAVLMLAVGVICTLVGIVYMAVGDDEVFTPFFLGTLLVIPGGYQTYTILRVYRKRPEFDLGQGPIYDE